MKSKIKKEVGIQIEITGRRIQCTAIQKFNTGNALWEVKCSSILVGKSYAKVYYMYMMKYVN